MIHHGDKYPSRLHRGARKMHMVAKGPRPIWMSPAAQQQVLKTWLVANVFMAVVMVTDSAACWFELEIILPGDFTGNPVDGWTGEMVAGKPPITVGLFYSQDLATWTDGGWITAPGKTTETLGDGRKKFFARYQPTPRFWITTLTDLTATSQRYGKSITDVSVLGLSLSLPNYPYDMPSDAALLQTDLRAAGYTGATVTTSSASLTAKAINYTVAGSRLLVVDQSGTNVTAVKHKGSTISLPAYPYSLPSQRATLQSALRTAGYDGAVVTLYADVWTIILPSVASIGIDRDFVLTYTPGDPFKTWDMFSNYLGEQPGNVVLGTSGNVRSPGGTPLTEAGRAFARIGIIHPHG